jgi:heme/copper-type cytochrome/quinol oxidase subunit 2
LSPLTAKAGDRAPGRATHYLFSRRHRPYDDTSDHHHHHPIIIIIIIIIITIIIINIIIIIITTTISLLTLFAVPSRSKSWRLLIRASRTLSFATTTRPATSRSSCSRPAALATPT